MIRIRRSNDRGGADHGWLNTRHTFSFGDYFDPAHMGFRSLRVINEDFVKAGTGFGTHGHKDMEIVTYVLEGELEHKDSLGNGSLIRPGDVQRMSAGTGVRHSEFNPSHERDVHLLQIWILPEREGMAPGYEQVTFARESLAGNWREIASRSGSGEAVKIHQDASIHAAVLQKGERASRPLAAGRHAWIQVARGAVRLGGDTLKAGDGAAISGEKSLEIAAEEPSEALLFDLA